MSVRDLIALDRRDIIADIIQQAEDRYIIEVLANQRWDVIDLQKSPLEPPLGSYDNPGEAQRHQRLLVADAILQHVLGKLQ